MCRVRDLVRCLLAPQQSNRARIGFGVWILGREETGGGERQICLRCCLVKRRGMVFGTAFRNHDCSTKQGGDLVLNREFLWWTFGGDGRFNPVVLTVTALASGIRQHQDGRALSCMLPRRARRALRVGKTVLQPPWSLFKTGSSWLQNSNRIRVKETRIVSQGSQGLCSRVQITVNQEATLTRAHALLFQKA